MDLLRWATIPVCLVAATGCGQRAVPAVPPTSSPSFSVLTYNVNWGSPDRKIVAGFLKRSGADLLCLQETHQAWEWALTPELRHVYPYRAFRHQQGASGLAILSKHRLRNVRLLPPRAGWFPALLAEVETPLGAMQILNVHLHPTLSEEGKVSLRAYFRTAGTRRKELRGFMAATDKDVPLIVAGDFNENERGKAVRWLIDRGYTDALSLYDTTSNTWQWTVAYGLTIRNRYDHILFSGDLACAAAKVTPLQASDHMPVEAVIIRRDTAGAPGRRRQ